MTPATASDHADHQRALQLSEGRQQQQREAQAADQGTDVVDGEHVGDGAAGLLPADPLQEGHQQRDLGADQQADHQGHHDLAGMYSCSQAKAAYSTRTDRPPISASTPSSTANATTARRRSGFAASEPTPMANTITEMTTEVCSTELPMR